MAASDSGRAAVADEFEWVDFAMQSPCTMAESLDAAGIGGELPPRDGTGADAEDRPGAY
jgi:hypothetical protein